MSIRAKCRCGQILTFEEGQVGKVQSCPSCGMTFRVPARGSTAKGAGATPPDQPAAPPRPPGPPAGPVLLGPPTPLLNVPTAVPEKLRRPGKPACSLEIVANRAVINADVHLKPILESLVVGFAKRARKKFDVQLGPPQPGTPSAKISVARIDQGSQFMRWLLGIFAGHAKFQVIGVVAGPDGKQAEFDITRRGYGGFLGGSAKGLLRQAAAAAGKLVAKKMLSVCK